MLLLLSWDIAGFREAQRHRRPFLWVNAARRPLASKDRRKIDRTAEGADSKSDMLSYRSGFTGGFTIVKDYVAGRRQRSTPLMTPMASPKSTWAISGEKT